MFNLAIVGLGAWALQNERPPSRFFAALPLMMAGVMLRAGARPDPADPPLLDANTTRVVWGRYPVRFGALS